MSIIKRGNSYWVDIGFNRRRYRKRSPDNSFKGAKAYELLLRGRLARGESLNETKEVPKATFKEIALQWLEVYVKNNNKLSEYKNRRNILNATIVPFFGSKHLDAITSFEIEQYKSFLLSERKFAPKTVNNHLTILSGCLKSAIELGMIKQIPKIKLLKVPPQKFDFLTEEETEKLLQTAYGIWYEMILVAVKTGMRFGELIAIKWEDIDFNENTLIICRNIVSGVVGSPKNNRTRVVPLASRVIEALKKRVQTTGYIFLSETGKQLIYETCLRRLQAICTHAGLRNIGWHVLRHSFASHLAMKGVPLISIKELLGHSDIKMTMRYAHINLPILKEAIAILEQPKISTAQ